VTGLVSEGDIDEDREDESDVWLERPSEDSWSLKPSSTSCGGKGRIVSAEVPGWKSTGTDRTRGVETWVSSRGSSKSKSSSDKETKEWEFEPKT
jgi:hypothetical protein